MHFCRNGACAFPTWAGGSHAGSRCFSDACCPGGVCDAAVGGSVQPWHAAFYYRFVYHDTGMLFARDKAPDADHAIEVLIHWKNAGGANVGDPVQYFINAELPKPSQFEFRDFLDPCW
jgi:hypothetical protein